MKKRIPQDDQIIVRLPKGLKRKFKKTMKGKPQTVSEIVRGWIERAVAKAAS